MPHENSPDESTPPGQRAAPLTPMQQGMLFEALRAEPGSGVYIEQVEARFTGALDIIAFQRAWGNLTGRHEVLHARAAWDCDPPALHVEPGAAPEVTANDWRGLVAHAAERQFEEFLRDDRARGFDLARAPLHRLAVFQFPGEHWRFVWTVHHLVIDGRGMAAVLREFRACYRGGGAADELPPPGSFLEFARGLARRDWGGAAAYWQAALARLDEPCRLPLPMPLAGENTHGVLRAELDAESAAGLTDFASAHGVTPATLVHAAWALLLHRYTGRNTVAFGATRALRGGAVAGLHINTLPFVAHIDQGLKLRDWLPRLRADWLAQREYDATPLPLAEQWSRVPAGEHLFDTYTVFERGMLDDLVHGGAPAPGESYTLHERTPASVTLAVYQRATLAIHLEFDAARFSLRYSAGLLEQFARLLASLPGHADTTLEHIDLFAPEERPHLLPVPGPPPPFRPVHAQIARRASLRPRHTAVRHRDERISYAALDRSANQLAHAFIARGAGPGTVVALALPRGIDAIIALLAVLKTGAAYLPLDPGLPIERRAFLLADSCAVLTVVPAPDAALPGAFALSEQAAHIDMQFPVAPGVAVSAQDAAYIIYTSGSTGQPKGVVVPHGALAAFVHGAARLYGITQRDRVLQFAALSFDAAAEEIFPTLTAGGVLVLRNDEMLASATGFIEQCRAWGVTVLDLPTAFWHLVVDALDRIEWPAAIRLVIIGGEAARPDRAAQWRAKVPARVQLANTYGPTETTVAVTCAFLEQESGDGPVPIGRPFPHVTAYVLDALQRPVPDGVPGELFIGGHQLALGYLGRDDLTGRAFILAPWDPALRLYRTGDRVYRREDGALVYLGRADRQVKIRGFRIELGEIEAVLRAVEGVAEAAVVVREDRPGLPDLCAYIARRDGIRAETLTERARQFLVNALPAYMQPASLTVLDAFPLNASGKVDLRALPAPQPAVPAGARLPRTPAEERVHAIWCEVFGVSALGCDDSFLDLGGHSLLAVQILSRVSVEFGVNATRAEFAAHPTIAQFAAMLESRPRAAPASIPRLPEGVPMRLAPDQQFLWVYERVYPGTPAYHIPIAFRIDGAIDPGLLQRGLAAVAARHDALRTVFTLVDGEAAMRVLPQAEIPWRMGDTAPDDDQAIAEWLMREAAAPFDIEHGPLLRAAQLRVGPAASVVCLTVHHLVCDGWSVGTITREWSEACAALAGGAEPAFPALPLRYADYAAWRAAQSPAPGGPADIFWRRQLAAPVPRWQWPGKDPGAPAEDGQGAQYPVQFPAAISEKLTALAHAHGVTPFALFFVLLGIALQRMTGQRDNVIGFSLAGRPRAELEPLVGFFLATLLLRLRTAESMRLDQFLRDTGATLLEAQEHEQTPFSYLRALDHAPTGETPLIQVLFLMQSMPLPPLAVPGASVTTLNVDLRKALADLTFELYPSARGYTGWFEYQTATFDRVTIARLAGLLGMIAEAAVATPFTPIGALPAWEACPAPARIAPPPPLAAPVAPPLIRINRACVANDVRPPDDTELKLIQLFERVLRVKGLTVNDNFFEHGGHSLLAIMLLDLIEREFGERLAPVYVYRAPTVRALAALLRGHDTAGPSRVVERIRPQGARPPLFFVGSTDMVPPLLPFLRPDQPVYGLNIFGLLPDDGPLPELTVQGIAKAYAAEVLAVWPQGPFRFAAYCRDTMLALELAQQLTAQGHTVDRLIAIDFFWDSRPRYPKPVRHLLNLYHFGPSYAAEKLREALRMLHELAARLRARFAAKRAADPAQDLPHNHRNAAYINAYYDAVAAYHVAEYPGHVHTVLVTEWGIRALPEWDDLAAGGTTLHLLKACHHNLWNPPQDQDLAAVITACLD